MHVNNVHLSNLHNSSSSTTGCTGNKKRGWSVSSRVPHSQMPALISVVHQHYEKTHTLEQLSHAVSYFACNKLTHSSTETISSLSIHTVKPSHHGYDSSDCLPGFWGYVAMRCLVALTGPHPPARVARGVTWPSLSDSGDHSRPGHGLSIPPLAVYACHHQICCTVAFVRLTVWPQLDDIVPVLGCRAG